MEHEQTTAVITTVKILVINCRDKKKETNAYLCATK